MRRTPAAPKKYFTVWTPYAMSSIDLEKPLWLDVNIKDFQKHAKARFNQDNFIEVLDFDFLEIQVIEEG